MDSAIAANVPLFLNTDSALDKFLNAYSLSKAQFVEWGKHLAQKKKVRFLNLKLEHFFGPDDEDSKFTTHVIQELHDECSRAKAHLGRARSATLYILMMWLQRTCCYWRGRIRCPPGLWSLPVGSGKAITIRQFAELIKKLTCSETMLNFGAYPYRDGDVMFSQADVEALNRLGWICEHTMVKHGLKADH